MRPDERRAVALGAGPFDAGPAWARLFRPCLRARVHEVGRNLRPPERPSPALGRVAGLADRSQVGEAMGSALGDGFNVVLLGGADDAAHPAASTPERETRRFLGCGELNDDAAGCGFGDVAPQAVPVLVLLVIAAGAVFTFAGQSVAVGLLFGKVVAWAYALASAAHSENLPCLGRVILKLHGHRAIVRAELVPGRLPVHRADSRTNGAAQSGEHTGPVAEALALRQVGFEAGSRAAVLTGDVPAPGRAAACH